MCSGIEAATVAWQPLGWQAVGFSEIDKFPSAVLQHYYPDVPNHGDMNDHERWPDTAIDVLVGGTPCQSFSVAGLRRGMADPRGNLALVYLAIAAQFRPRWLVWENVPGVLSSDGGRDFGALIGAMVKLGYCPSWRVLDAQYFGVAQRRRRVFVVASARDWRDSAQVLFEPESMRRHPPPRRGPGQEPASTLRTRAPGSGGQGTDGEQCVSHALNAGEGIKAADTNTYIPEVAKSVRTHSGGIDREDMHTLLPDVVGALSDGAHCGGGLNGQDAYSGRVFVQPVADSITANEQRTYTHEGKTFRTRNVQAFAENQRGEVREREVTDSLKVAGGKPGQGYQAVRSDMVVRRLTPLECERLQGFPDGYTDIPGASDSARYRALGNTMAVPVMRWLGERIQHVNGE